MNSSINDLEIQIRAIHTKLANAKNINSTILLSLRTCEELDSMCNYYISLLSSEGNLLPEDWKEGAIFYIGKLKKKEISIQKAIEFFSNYDKRLRTTLKLFNESYFID